MNEITYKPRTRNFGLPKRLMQNDRIAKLSSDALRVYLVIAHKIFNDQQLDVIFIDTELAVSLCIQPPNLRRVWHELTHQNLIEFRRGKDKTTTSYRLVRDLFKAAIK